MNQLVTDTCSKVSKHGELLQKSQPGIHVETLIREATPYDRLWLPTYLAGKWHNDWSYRRAPLHIGDIMRLCRLNVWLLICSYLLLGRPLLSIAIWIPLLVISPPRVAELQATAMYYSYTDSPRWLLFTSEILWGCVVSMSDCSSARKLTLWWIIKKTVKTPTITYHEFDSIKYRWKFHIYH